MKATLFALTVVAAAALGAVSERHPFESEFFGPELLLSHTDTLDLSDEQVNEIHGIADRASPAFAVLRRQLDDRMGALGETIKVSQPDFDDFEAKLRAVLAVEAEMKVLQGRALLAMRMKLTPEQVVKAREVKDRELVQETKAAATGDSRENLVSRLEDKLKRIQAGAEKLLATGRDPSAVGAIVENFEPLMKEGKLKEAEALLDRALKALEQYPNDKPK
ncbi:MAG: Spy/CpxP family protein refolding chaperone [Planctomycetaceae bacterium]